MIYSNKNSSYVLYKETLYATGLNDYGQLGTGGNDNKNQLTPMQLQGLPPGVTALHAVCGDGRTVVLGTNGLCYATGSNGRGQLGTGNNAPRNILTPMQGLLVIKEVKTLLSITTAFILSQGPKEVMQKIMASRYDVRVIELVQEQLPAHLLYCNNCHQIKPSFSQKVIEKRKRTGGDIIRVFASNTAHCLGCAIILHRMRPRTFLGRPTLTDIPQEVAMPNPK